MHRTSPHPNNKNLSQRLCDMKKVKVTKKSNPELILQPSVLRMYLIYTLMFVLAYAFGLLIRFFLYREQFNLAQLTSDWLVDTLIVFAGPLVLAFIYKRRWMVKVIGRDTLEGPTGAFSERIQLPLREINWAMTERSIGSKFGLANAIYAGGRRILVNAWFFNPAEWQEFLERIGYTGNRA